MPGKLTPRVSVSLSGQGIAFGGGTTGLSGGGTGADADFIARRSAPGVIRWFDFNTLAQFGGGYGANVGNLSNSSDPLNLPQLDTAIKASGAASMRFDVRSQSFFDGEWWANFSADLLTQFGNQGDEFFVQVRTRWNQAFYDTVFQVDSGHSGIQGGIKFFDVSAGDTATTIQGSSANLKAVLQTYYQDRFPQVYGYDPVGNNTPMFETFGGDFKLQNAMPSPFCLYSVASPLAAGANAVSGCFNIVPNEWLTWQIGITITGRRVVNTFSCLDYRLRLWGAREGQASQLLIDFNQNTPGYFPLLAQDASGQLKFGKVNLFPYITYKDPTQVHGLAQCWYDEVIISTQQIADPAVGNFATLGGNAAQDLGAYACTDLVGDPAGQCKIGPDFSGMVHDPIRNRMVFFGGGHAGTNYNAINTFPLATKVWTEEYLPTPCSSLTVANFDYSRGAFVSGPNGPYPRPSARHTEDLMVIIPDELIVLTNSEGNGQGCGISDTLTFLAPLSKICHYDFVGKTWTFTNAQTPANEYPAASYDPLSAKVILIGQTAMDVYDPQAKTITRVNWAAGMIKDEGGNNISSGALAYNNNLIYCPLDQKHYYFERYSGNVYRVDLNRSSFSLTTLTRLNTTGSGPAADGIEIGFAFDSHNNLIGGGPRNNVFYAFNPLTKAWTNQTVTGSTPGSVAYHCLDYSPADNVYIFITDAASARKTWAYRWN